MKFNESKLFKICILAYLDFRYEIKASYKINHLVESQCNADSTKSL